MGIRTPQADIAEAPLSERIFDTLARGGATALNVLDYPKQEVLEAFTGFRHGVDIAEAYGIEGYSKYPIGISIDIAADPLTYLGIGWSKALGKANDIRQIQRLRTLEKVIPLIKSADITKNLTVTDLAEISKKLDTLLIKRGLTRETVDELNKEVFSSLSKPRRFIEKLNPIKTLRQHFRQTALSEQGKVIQELDKILKTTQLRKAGIGLTETNQLITKAAKETGLDRQEILEQVINIRENLEYAIPKNQAIAQARIRKLAHIAPDETIEALQTNDEALRRLGIVNDTFLKEGLNPQLSEQLTFSFMRNGGNKLATKERIEHIIKNMVDPNHSYIARLVRTLNNTDPRILEVTDDIRAKFAKSLQDDILFGLPITELEGRGYIFHLISQEGKEYLKTIPAAQRKLLFKELDTRFASTRKRTIKTDLLTVNRNIEKASGGQVKEFFTTDLGKLYFTREYNAVRARGAAFTVDAIANVFAGAHAGGETLTDLFHAAKITRWRPAWADESIEFGIKPNKKKIQKLLEEKGLGALTVPREIFQDLKITIESLSKGATDPFLRKVVDLYDQWMGLTRGALTVYIPAYHARNALGGFFNGAILSGAAFDPRTWIEFLKGVAVSAHIHLGKLVNKKFSDLAEEVLDIGIAGKGITNETRDLINTLPGLNILKKINKGLQPGFTFGSFIEDAGRIGLYLARRKQGWDKIRALQDVHKYLFDYQHGLTQFEKTVARRTALFYSWMRFNIPLQLEHLFSPQHIYKQAFIGRLPGLIPNNYTFAHRQDIDPDRPSFLDQPDTITLYDDIDLVINAGLPFSDLQFGIQGQGLGGVLRKNFISPLSPVLKLPLELAFGKESFLGRDIDRYDRANVLGRVLNKIPILRELADVRELKDGGYRINPTLNTILHAMPTSRFVSLLERTVDTRLTPDQQSRAFWSSLLYGNVHDLPEAKKREVKNLLRRKAAILKNQGLLREGQFFYATTPEVRRTAREINRSLQK